jgi:hypothetical protein
VNITAKRFQLGENYLKLVKATGNEENSKLTKEEEIILIEEFKKKKTIQRLFTFLKRVQGQWPGKYFKRKFRHLIRFKNY